jgi:hypothetical protein
MMRIISLEKDGFGFRPTTAKFVDKQLEHYSITNKAYSLRHGTPGGQCAKGI